MLLNDKNFINSYTSAGGSLMRFKVLLLALILALSFTGMVMAQKPTAAPQGLTPYASFRTWMGYVHRDSTVNPDATGVQNKDTDFRMYESIISRMGFKGNSNGVFGNAELGIDKYNGVLGVYLRLAFVTWDFGMGELKVGRDWTPYSYFNSSGATWDSGAIGFGSLWDDRQNQVMLTLKPADGVGLYLSLINPSRNIQTAANTTMTVGANALTDDYIDVTAPKVSVGLKYNAEGIFFNVGGAYNYVTIKDEDGMNSTAVALDGKKIVSYLLYLQGKVTVDIFHFAFNVGGYQNAGNFNRIQILKHGTDKINVSGNLADGLVIDPTTGKITDTKVMEGFAEIGLKFTDEISIQGGIGFAMADNDLFAERDTQVEYWGQFTIMPVKGLRICPAYGFRDYKKGPDFTSGLINGKYQEKKQGTEWLAGIYFRADI